MGDGSDDGETIEQMGRVGANVGGQIGVKGEGEWQEVGALVGDEMLS